ncbi:MAG: reverse transcriptase family protein, partial [Akkermansia sp.]
MPFFSSRISLSQMGFMPERFIGEQGRLLQLAQLHAQQYYPSAIDICLDQQKAYDRVHPFYLEQVLQRFGIPSSLVHTIINLFFSTRVHININGNITSPFTASRGLRQGDPLSPLLYNIALDPFLRLLSQDSSFPGFSFELPIPLLPPDPSVTVVPPPLKVLAYADDTLVFLRDQSDFLRLQHHLDTYCSATNAKLNFSKTEVFPLSGIPNPEWKSFLQSFNITTWYDRTSSTHLRYLGYPIFFSTAQKNSFFDTLLQKITTACQIHSQRQLSIRGRVTILNSLILSRLWHVLRLFPLNQTHYTKLKGIISKFINNPCFPKLSFSTLVSSRSVGGLGVLDPAIQVRKMQWRWLCPLLLS